MQPYITASQAKMILTKMNITVDNSGWFIKRTNIPRVLNDVNDHNIATNLVAIMRVMHFARPVIGNPAGRHNLALSCK